MGWSFKYPPHCYHVTIPPKSGRIRPTWSSRCAEFLVMNGGDVDGWCLPWKQKHSHKPSRNLFLRWIFFHPKNGLLIRNSMQFSSYNIKQMHFWCEKKMAVVVEIRVFFLYFLKGFHVLIESFAIYIIVAQDFMMGLGGNAGWISVDGNWRGSFSDTFRFPADLLEAGGERDFPNPP